MQACRAQACLQEHRIASAAAIEQRRCVARHAFGVAHTNQQAALFWPYCPNWQTCCCCTVHPILPTAPAHCCCRAALAAVLGQAAQAADLKLDQLHNKRIQQRWIILNEQFMQLAQVLDLQDGSSNTKQ